MIKEEDVMSTAQILYDEYSKDLWAKAYKEAKKLWKRRFGMNIEIEVEKRVCDEQKDLILRFFYKLNDSIVYLNKTDFISEIEDELNYLTNKFVEDELNENLPNDIFVAHDLNEDKVIEKAINRIRTSIKKLEKLNVERRPYHGKI